MQTHPLKIAILASLALPLSAFAASPDFSRAGAPNKFSAVVQRAQGLVGVPANAKALQRADGDDFVAADVTIDANGDSHTRFKRSFQGLPVIFGDTVVHSRNGLLAKASTTLRSAARPASLKPRISADEAMVTAGVKFAGTIDQLGSNGLVVYARGAKPVLAYEVRVRGVSERWGSADMRYFVDATSNKVLDGWNIFKTAAATGTGKTLLLGNVSITTDKVSSTSYRLLDPTRGNGSTRNGNNKVIDSVYNTAPIFTDADNVWGTNTTSSGVTAAADAHYGVAATWDFYKNTFGRNGIFNDGVGVKSIVNVKFYTPSGTTTPNNAGWYGAPYKFMAYGYGGGSYNPFVALDVAGHEMTHGVTEATADLAYSGDAGGLNEASSDIMGTLVEFSIANANDPGDYLIGEKIYKSNPGGTTALRYMFKPSVDGDSHDCYPSGGFPANDDLTNDPHYTSGVGNHFFYLLAEGAVVPTGFGSGTTFNLTPAKLVCNGDTTVAGIGRSKAGAIWYRALTVYMNSGTTYPQARTATLNAATDLYGAGSAEYNAVAKAWSAVSVN
ncbi:M4 family metallopeptidase [Luteimonas aquatica]|uniref:M4 family metallopeptidase n=1 Tax=Luteimonas aquatica TaxID=450364 RepID=UPI001F56CC6C|nr:M4 family metallopeptidase [Luteimonas aquatica]